jgi:MYXO-CTERM domain-containing protein
MFDRVSPRFFSFPSVIAAVAAAATLTTATAAHADVVWVGGFETGDLSQWTFVAHGEYIHVQSELVGEGEHAARIELHNDAVWPNGLKRVELQHLPNAPRTAEGATTFFAFSFYLPEALPEEHDHAIAYWESNNSYQQVMAFNVQGDDIVFATRRPSNVQQWQADDVVTPGVWHRIAMRITWSTGQGSVSAWFDGEQVVDDAVAQTLADGNAHFVQLGILRDAIEFADMPVIVLDDAIEGDSLEDVRPLDIPGVDGEDGGSSDGGGEGTGDPGVDETGGPGGALDTSGGGPGDDTGPLASGDDDTSAGPSTSTGDDWALPPGFSATNDDAGASGDGGEGCQCSGGTGSGRTGTAWGLVLLTLLGMRRRLIRRR